MNFLYPLGFLGLIGVPVLIIIYIIKNKYTEQVIASTYLWTLSEKFLKKRLPINKLVGIISLILQILAVIFLSIALAHPVIVMRGAAENYYFVLDCSGSMNIEQNGKTRLELAKDEISEIIADSVNGSTYSLVLVNGAAEGAAESVFEEVENKDWALNLLSGVSCGYSAAELNTALGGAQKYFNGKSGAKTYLVTDKTVLASDNVEVINVSGSAENYAVSNVTYAYAQKNLTVAGTAVAYGSDKTLTLELRLNGAVEVAATQSVEVTGGEPLAFTMTCEDVTEFSSFTLRLAEEDALAIDNEITVYNVEYENSYSTLVVSDRPFFIQAMLLSVGKSRTKVATTEQYKDKGAEGYDLYIFDSYSPEILPSDGAVWFFGPTASVAETGFTVQDEVIYSVAEKLVYSNSTSSFVRTLKRDLVFDDIYVIKYQKCGFYRSFTTLLSCDGNPVVFTGVNTYGNREVVFSFDLHDSNFPLLTDFVVLAGNLLSYSFPTVIENASYECGEILLVNAVANCNSIRVDTPEGNIRYLDTSSAVCELQLTEVGTYKITMSSGDTSREFNVYASLPETERNPVAAENAFSLAGEATKSTQDGIFDQLWILFVLLAVIFVADWVVYCYEQYQLR